MDRWEYLRLHIKYRYVGNTFENIFINGRDILVSQGIKNHSDLHAYVLTLGLEGWEMVSATSADYSEVIYFKRLNL